MNEDKRTTLRLPEDLHQWSAEQARAAHRSVNSEIVHRLEAERAAVVADDPSP
ncbi:Arc family DNA-binding protein [Streptomyces cyaneofuscatus]|uniref:Arc family DNA-binding protein n=1 Tax=Streptomyces cyaneofuscatus TaxID=66883 RepID=UPI0036BD7FCC